MDRSEAFELLRDKNRERERALSFSPNRHKVDFHVREFNKRLEEHINLLFHYAHLEIRDRIQRRLRK